MLLIHDDCLKYMNSLEGEIIDMTVTSPPYGNLREYKGVIWNSNIWKKIIKELFRITKSGGVVAWITGDQTTNYTESGESFRQALFAKEIGFCLYDTMIYHKTSAPCNDFRYSQDFEYIFIFSKGKPKTWNPIKVPCIHKNKWNTSTSDRLSNGVTITRKGRKTLSYKKKSNVWQYDVGFQKTTKDLYAYEHPAMFPESLVKDLIISWTNPRDLIFDPMMGSGTVGKIAMLLERDFIGVEIAKEYFRIAQKRINKNIPLFFTKEIKTKD